MCLPPSSPQTLAVLDDLLPSDHKLVTWETAFLSPYSPGPRPYCPHRRTGRWQVDTGRLHGGLEQTTPSQCDWRQLSLLARHCQYRRPSCKYKDSVELKQLCRLRNTLTDPNQRASMPRHILATRRAERARWLHDLHAAASAGDASAIAFLKAKHKPKTTWNHLIGHSGSQPSAIQNVKDHFQQLFAKTSLTDRSTACASHLAMLQAHMATTSPQPISSEEVIQALTKLKMTKTSGSTGMSNEFLLALGHTDDGELLLRRLLNTMLVQGDIHPDLLIGIACLIPKSASPTLATQIRPIVLLEAAQKLYASILMQRLAPHWPPLTAQLGAVPGGQPVEALFAAQHMMAIARVTGKEPIFIKLDIKGAFDNLSHASVASFLATLPAAACHEAMQLMTLLLEQKLRFSFLNEHWDIHCTNGTPQGGSHSAGLFARTLDHAIGGLLSSREADGYTPAFPPLWLLLFVDDILLCFSDWAEAIRLLPTFLACLSKQGLEVNFSKSCLIASHVMLSRTPQQDMELLKMFPWVQHTQYLRKSFGYNLDTDAMHQQAIQLIFGAWGKLKPILKKSHWTYPSTTIKLLDQYVGPAFPWLSPTLYPYQLFRRKLRVTPATLLIEALNLFIPSMIEDEAHQILRFRRHQREAGRTSFFDDIGLSLGTFADRTSTAGIQHGSCYTMSKNNTKAS